jgi:shikimate kinase
MKKNIYLIGFMASGKTVHGKRLASFLHYNFLDLDQLIESTENKKINEIFSIYGENYFRKIEKLALHQTFLLHNTVVSLGGGTPCFFDNMEEINKHGISLYLKANTGVLTARLKKNIGQRPLLANKNEIELEKYIKDTLSEREIFYSRSALSCDATNISIQTISQALTPLL